MGLVSDLKDSLSGDKLSEGDALKTSEIRERPENYRGEIVVVKGYYYSRGIISTDRDYLSSEKIRFEEPKKLYRYAPQILPITKIEETQTELSEKGKQYLVKGKVKRTGPTRVFDSLILDVKNIEKM